MRAPDAIVLPATGNGRKILREQRGRSPSSSTRARPGHLRTRSETISICSGRRWASSACSNRTSTPLGGRRLRDVVDSPSLSPEHIRQRQEAVRWLAEHSEPRLGMMGTLTLLRNHGKRVDRFATLLHVTERPPRSSVSTAIRLWSVVSGLVFLSSVLGIANGRYGWVDPLKILLMVNIAILIGERSLFRRFAAIVSPWTTLRSTLRCFLAVAQHGERDLPEETQLQVLKRHFRDVASNAHIPSLCEWLEWAGLHGLVRGLLNLLVFFDLNIAEAVLARIVPNRDTLLRGLSAMAELEAPVQPGLLLRRTVGGLAIRSRGGSEASTSRTAAIPSSRNRMSRPTAST